MQSVRPVNSRPPRLVVSMLVTHIVEMPTEATEAIREFLEEPIRAWRAAGAIEDTGNLPRIGDIKSSATLIAETQISHLRAIADTGIRGFGSGIATEGTFWLIRSL